MSASPQSSPQAIALSVRLCASVDVNPPEDDLPYVNVWDAATEAVRRSATDPESIRPILDLAEATLEGADPELRTLVALGLFEDMQTNLFRGLGDGEAVLSLLGPRSRRVWSIVERRWSGDEAAFREDW
jgi:hypothetical protein